MNRSRTEAALVALLILSTGCGGPSDDISAGTAAPKPGDSSPPPAGSSPSPTPGANPPSTAGAAPTSGEFVKLGDKLYDVVRSCTGNPVIAVMTKDALLGGPGEAVFELWSDEGVGLYLQFEPGGPVWTGEPDPASAHPFSSGAAALSGPNGEKIEISYALDPKEPCDGVTLRDASSDLDADGWSEGPYWSVLDVCFEPGTGAFTAWLNEGMAVNLTLEGQGEGAFGAVVSSALNDQTFSTIDNSGQWSSVLAGGLMGHGTVYAGGVVGQDDRVLSFGFPGALIRECGG